MSGIELSTLAAIGLFWYARRSYLKGQRAGVSPQPAAVFGFTGDGELLPEIWRKDDTDPPPPASYRTFPVDMLSLGPQPARAVRAWLRLEDRQLEAMNAIVQRRDPVASYRRDPESGTLQYTDSACALRVWDVERVSPLNDLAPNMSASEESAAWFHHWCSAFARSVADGDVPRPHDSPWATLVIEHQDGRDKLRRREFRARLEDVEARRAGEAIFFAGRLVFDDPRGEVTARLRTKEVIVGVLEVLRHRPTY